MSIIIQARDGKIIIPKTYFERYLDIGWFFSGLVKFPFNVDNNGDEENNSFTLWESKDAILSLFDSIKFNKLTIHNNISLDYLYHLADMWCSPEWLINDLKNEKEKKEKKILLNDSISEKINNYIFECKICNSGFKLSENTSSSCKFHSGNFVINGNIFMCCGRDNSIGNTCSQGYHIPKDYLYILQSLKK